jgi:hypothetical protein
VSNKIIVIQECELHNIISSALRTELAAFKPKATEPQIQTDFLTRKQTAKRLQISLVTLSAWTKKGLLKGYRISGQIRYKSGEIEQSLNNIKTDGGF